MLLSRVTPTSSPKNPGKKENKNAGIADNTPKTDPNAENAEKTEKDLLEEIARIEKTEERREEARGGEAATENDVTPGSYTLQN